jgi:hypothetical protein
MGYMSQTVTYAQVLIPVLDSAGNFLPNPDTFLNAVAALTVDGRCWVGSGGNIRLQDGSTVCGYYSYQFFLNPANDATALTLYTNYVASLPAGTITQVFYSTYTLGA